MIPALLNMDERNTASAPVTELLRLCRKGDAVAEDRLFRAVFSDLRRLAASNIRSGEERAVLEPTELVNEVYLRLFGTHARDFNSRAHFFGVAASAMHCVMIDLARKRKSAKHGWGCRQALLAEILPAGPESWPDKLLAFEEVFERFSRFDSRGAKIIELKVFMGLNEEQIAEILGISVRTVRRDLRAARCWLEAELDLPSGTGH